MKKYPKRNNFALKCVIFLLIILTGATYSCRKEVSKSNEGAKLTITDPKVAEAKTWYENTYPVNSSKGQPLHTNSTTSIDISQSFKPDWLHADQYERLGKEVIELPFDPGAKFGLALKTNTWHSTIAYSRSYYLLIEDAEKYEAYILTIIADSAYVKDDLSKLSHNTYRKHDADFSGLVIYSTPKGEYLGGYAYKNGQLVTAEETTLQTGTQTVQSVGKKKIKPSNIVQTCTDWYQQGINISSNGEITYVGTWTYLETTCTYSGGGEGTGGGGTGGGGSTGGGSGGDSSAPPAPPPPKGCPSGSHPGPPVTPPCIPTNVASIDNNQLTVNVVPPPSDGGMPPAPPTVPTCSVDPPRKPCPPVPPKGFRPLCKSSIVLKSSTNNSNEVNMLGVQFGITDMPHFPLYKTQINVIEFNLYINIPNQIKDPVNKSKNVTITLNMQKDYIYKAFHFASEQVNAVHGQDFFSAGAQPKYSKMFADYMLFYLNSIALQGMFPAYENSNPGLVPSLGTRTSTLINPAKATPAVYTTGVSGEGC